MSTARFIGFHSLAIEATGIPSVRRRWRRRCRFAYPDRKQNQQSDHCLDSDRDHTM